MNELHADNIPFFTSPPKADIYCNALCSVLKRLNHMCTCVCKYICVCVCMCMCMLYRVLLPTQVEFYISQSQASNHAVREAACTCIAELGTKVVIIDAESERISWNSAEACTQCCHMQLVCCSSAVGPVA